ncbi:hypothetical protein D3C81_1947440 [compost metagenome]
MGDEADVLRQLHALVQHLAAGLARTLHGGLDAGLAVQIDPHAAVVRGGEAAVAHEAAAGRRIVVGKDRHRRAAALVQAHFAAEHGLIEGLGARQVGAGNLEPVDGGCGTDCRHEGLLC